MVIPDKLMDFLNEARQPLPPINDADELLHLDSLAMIKLVAFLESELGFTVADDQLVLTNFENVHSIGRLLQGQGVTMA
jgi:acyl carrier protein